MSKAAIIVGAGPGIGQSVAQRFAREGFDIGLVARSDSTIATVSGALEPLAANVAGSTADVADEAALRRALTSLGDDLGTPDVLVYNAALIQWDELGALRADEHLAAWAVNVVGAITTLAYIGPLMEARGRGSILLTGGMPTPIPDVTSLSLGKAGVRALTELAAARFGSSGVHVATVTVGGAVAPGTAFDPDDIAEEYWRLHRQDPESWEREVLYAGRERQP